MKRKFQLAIILTVILSFVLPAFDNKAQAATGIDVSNVVLKPGKTKKVTVEGLGTGFTWTSSNTSVAKVTRKVKADNSATITAKGEGVAVITATKGSSTYQCSVVVMDKVETKDTSGTSSSKSKAIKDITVYDKTGTVSVVRSKKTVKAVKDMKLKNNDYGIIGKDSFLRLCLDDESYAYFESGTEFAVSKAWFSKIKICMTKGEMILEVQKKLDKDASVDVITPNAAMSIRGTVVAIKTIPEKDGRITTVNYVLEGTAEVTYKDKKTKKEKVVTLKAGEGWETTTNKKGKVVSNKKADASKFDFENIELDKLKGADGNELIIKGKDFGNNDKNNTDKENGSETGTGSDNGNGTASESGSNTGDATGSDNGSNTENGSGSGSGSDTGNTETGSDAGSSDEDTFELAAPAIFDYDESSFYPELDPKEERPNENTFITKEYDAFGTLRHKYQSVENWSENNKGSDGYSTTEWCYDTNSVLRIYRTSRTEFPSDNSDYNNQGNYPKEIIYTTEKKYDSNKVVIYENSVDESYDTTTWYDAQGRKAEYIRMTVYDQKVVEHYYYWYNKNGEQKVTTSATGE